MDANHESHVGQFLRPCQEPALIQGRADSDPPCACTDHAGREPQFMDVRMLPSDRSPTLLDRATLNIERPRTKDQGWACSAQTAPPALKISLFKIHLLRQISKFPRENLQSAGVIPSCAWVRTAKLNLGKAVARFSRARSSDASSCARSVCPPRRANNPDTRRWRTGIRTDGRPNWMAIGDWDPAANIHR